MIPSYSDHAANERTFLAWVRTGIAVIAFGFVIEKFNLFVLSVAIMGGVDAGRRAQLETLSQGVGRYDGMALILIGLAVIVVAAARFVRTARLLDKHDVQAAGGVRAGVILATTLALLIGGFSTYLDVGRHASPFSDPLFDFDKKESQP